MSLRADAQKSENRSGVATVGTALTPICNGGFYQTPQVGGEQQLRIQAGGDANDTAAGTGAREVTLCGIDNTGAYVTETIATAGASASALTTTIFLRLCEFWVSASGTYVTQAGGSHAADITIEDGSANVWGVISSTPFPASQSQLAAFTVPLGKRVYVPFFHLSGDSTKVTTAIMFFRDNILETAAPYTAGRLVNETILADSGEEIKPTAPFGPFGPLTDVIWMAKVDASTGQVECDYEMIWENA